MENPSINTDPSLDERAELLRRAKMVGLTHSPNIGTDTLRAKLDAFLNDREDPTADVLESQTISVPENESPAARDQRLRKEIQADQLALVRVRITNMNPAKADLRGEIWTVANKYVGTVRKFIPYGEAAEVGYHIPKILLSLLQEQKYHQIKTRQGKDKREIVAESKMVKEFAIEILPHLTEKEFAALKASQMARGDITADV